MDMFYAILMLMTGIGVFLVGIVLFSETLTKNTSGKLRRLITGVSKNRATGFGLGLGVTAVTQSSAVTTVMVVGLVNAGLLTLFQATAIIFGANVGSALTTLIVSLSAFKIKYFFMALAFVGAFTKLVTKKENLAFIANLFIGFGLIFAGLDLMSSAFSGNASIKNAFTDLFASADFPLLLILFGILFTLITQSSTATIAIIVSMMAANLLTFSSGMYLIIGASIGSTVTALLASISANTNAKRAALIHFLFNFLGAIMITAFVWPFQGVFVKFFTGIVTDPVWQISIFHLVYKITVAFVLIWFIRPLNNLAIKIIKEIPQDIDILRTSFIDDELLEKPAVALNSTIQEIGDMAQRAYGAVNLAFGDLIDRGYKNKEMILKEKLYIDFLHQSITQYLVKISGLPITPKDKKLIGKYYQFTNDVKRIAGHSVYMISNVGKMRDAGQKFTKAINAELNKVFAKLTDLYKDFLQAFESNDHARLEVIAKQGTELKNFCDNFASTYLDRLAKRQFSVELGDYYYATMISFRSVSSYIAQISAGLVTEIK